MSHNRIIYGLTLHFIKFTCRLNHMCEEHVSSREAQTGHHLKPLGHHQTLSEAMGRNLFQRDQDTLDSFQGKGGEVKRAAFGDDHCKYLDSGRMEGLCLHISKEPKNIFCGPEK